MAKVWAFVYLVLPVINKFCKKDLIDCPCCGELLQKYDEGYLHMADGDRDCYGMLGAGK